MGDRLGWRGRVTPRMDLGSPSISQGPSALAGRSGSVGAGAGCQAAQPLCRMTRSWC